MSRKAAIPKDIREVVDRIVADFNENFLRSNFPEHDNEVSNGQCD
jgi:hypothetical protein